MHRAEREEGWASPDELSGCTHVATGATGRKEGCSMQAHAQSNAAVDERWDARLHRREAHAPSRPEHEDRLPGAQAAAVEQSHVGRPEGYG